MDVMRRRTARSPPAAPTRTAPAAGYDAPGRTRNRHPSPPRDCPSFFLIRIDHSPVIIPCSERFSCKPLFCYTAATSIRIGRTELFRHPNYAHPIWVRGSADGLIGGRSVGGQERRVRLGGRAYGTVDGVRCRPGSRGWGCSTFGAGRRVGSGSPPRPAAAHPNWVQAGSPKLRQVNITLNATPLFGAPPQHKRPRPIPHPAGSAAPTGLIGKASRCTGADAPAYNVSPLRGWGESKEFSTRFTG
jgi:hypothetical protein